MKFNYYFVLSLNLYIFYSTCQRSDNVTYIETIIKKQINESLHYEYPKDASKYRPSSDKIHDFGVFDFIIVGSGSTGSVIANRLSENQNWKILLIEACDFGNDLTDIPNMWSVLQLSNFNWGYKSIPQKTACLTNPEQKCLHTCGCGIGGSSLINGLMYVRGNKKDFDDWAQLGNPGWSYDEVLPYFKKSENLYISDPNVVVDWGYHGKSGELNVSYSIPRHPMTSFWLEANKEKGYNIVDYNGKQQLGAAVTQVGINKGKRADTGNCFIKSIKDRQNLTILKNAYVTKIITKNKNAIGVKFTHQKKQYIAKVTKEVILSAGAFGSSKILLLSGIGPKKDLKKIGIQSVADLPVGSKLEDHPMFWSLSFSTNHTEITKPLDHYVEEYFNGTGPMTSPMHLGGLGFYKSRLTKLNYPDLELIMFPNDGFSNFLNEQLAQSKQPRFSSGQKGGSFAIAMYALHSRSSGTVKLKNKDPFSYPLIDSYLLSDMENRDVDTLYEGVKIALDLIKTQTYGKINATLIKPEVPACHNKTYLSKEYWYCLIKYSTVSALHHIGTCPMGPDPKTHVVNFQAKVHGIGNLRIADASIFPFPLSGHPYAVCVMIGEKVSDLIKKEYDVRRG